jgi:hypothetical protein
LTRLFKLIESDYRAIRFDVRTQLDPKNFTPFDVVLLMMVLLVEETFKVTGKRPEASLMIELLRWFADDKVTRHEEVATVAEAAGGIDTKNSWWDKVVGAFVTVKGSLKYTALRQKEVIEYKLTRIDSLMATANALLRNCTHLLNQKEQGKRWVFAGESFDKDGIPSENQIELFLIHGSTIFQGLDANLIFNLPLAMVYGSRSTELPELPRHTIFDTPVFTNKRTPYEPGRRFVREIVHARALPELFAEGVLDRLIVASGANLRDLFRLIRDAGLQARRRIDDSETPVPGRVEASDANRAIDGLKFEMQSRLGTTQYDRTPIENERKIDQLVELYRSADTGVELPGDVLQVLLTANAVQEFNGSHWFGVHPLIVDYLKRAKKIDDDAPGGTQ